MKNRKIIYILMIIAIIFGAVMIWKKDFNYGTLYSTHKRLEVAIVKDHDINDIQKIAKESFDSDVIARNSTLFSTSIAIDVKNMNDDQIKNFFTKINEKYGTSFDIKELKKIDILEELNVESISELSDDEINSLISQIKEKYGYEYTKDELLNETSSIRYTDVAKTNIINVIRNFIMPMIVSLAIVAVYFAIRYRNECKHAWILKPLKLVFEMILNQAFIISVIAITRIPVSSYIPILLIFIWLIQILSETIKEEEKLKLANKEE